MKVLMKKKVTIIETRPIRGETLTADQFIKLTAAQKRNIKNTTILPPKLGKEGFAGFRVQYKTPLYKAG